MKSSVKFKTGLKILLVFLVIFVAGQGLFHKYNQKGDSNADELFALPYLAYVEDDPNPDTRGIAFHEKNLSFDGINLFVSSDKESAKLIDMNGNLIHNWTSKGGLGSKWRYAQLDEDGNLYVFIEGSGLVKMDWDSRVIWMTLYSENPLGTGRYHHDFEIVENGDILILGAEGRKVNYNSQEVLIRDDIIVTLDSEGVPKNFISFYDVLGGQIPQKNWEVAMSKTESVKIFLRKIRNFIRQKSSEHLDQFDIFHSNTVEEIKYDIGVAKKGDILFCIRNLNLIGILDRETEELVWSWGPGVLDRPHNPTVLANGNILVFDNGVQRGYSRVLEIDPSTAEIVWKFEADPREAFFTQTRGGSQRLPNGNTLITESGRGHVFEVTMGGELVWDFWNPDTHDNDKRATIFRIDRYNNSLFDFENLG